MKMKTIKNNFKKKRSNKKTIKNEKNDCEKSANTFNSFVKEYEKTHVFKNKKNIGINKELNNLISLHKTPAGVTAQNDFFTFINYLWILQQSKNINKKKDKKYYVQVDNFRMTQEKVFHQLIDIVKETKQNQVKNLYNSILSLDQKSLEKCVREQTQKIDEYIASNKLIDFLAYINKNEIVSWGCPIYWKMMADEKNPGVFIGHITSPVMGMYEYEILAEPAEMNDEARKYRDFYKRKRIENITIIFDTMLEKNHGLTGADVWDVEFELFTMLGCSEIKIDSDEYYNVLNAEQSLEYGFNWTDFSKALGYKTPPKKFIAASLNYLKCVMKLLTDNWKSPKWKSYWYYIYLRQMSRFGDSYEKLLYGFAGKFIQAQDVIFPRELLPIFALSMGFNSFLTKEYLAKYKKQENIDYVKNMAEDLKLVFIRILKRNTWLTEKTKKYAILKLNHLKLIVGSPEIKHEDPSIIFSSKDAWGNMEKIMNWRSELFVSLDNNPMIDIPYIDWREMPFKLIGKQSYIVNAYYTPIENSIYIPLAYIQKPFIDLEERGIEYNLAHIGFTISHELSHSLDNIGSKYDYNGKLFNWWSSKDREKYDFKLKDIVKQYEVFAGYDDINFDVHMSLSEDLADISGLAICEEYLRDFQDKNDDIAYIRKLSFSAFFCYYAIQARQAISKKAISAQLKNNPHPLDKYRVNCTLARLELFKSIYEVKKTDKMYWESSDTFWGHD